MNFSFYPHANPLLSHYFYAVEGLSFKVYPNLGASLHGLTFNETVIIKDIVDEDALDEALIYYRSSLLFPFPNRLQDGSFEHEGTVYQLQKNHLDEHAIHGCVAKARFQTKQATPHKIVLTYAHLADINFPFCFQLDVTYVILETGIQLQFDVTNTGTTSFPFGIGWHPYFELNDIEEAQISFGSTTEFTTNEELIITGNRPFDISSIQVPKAKLDNAYQLDDNVITLVTGAYQVQIRCPDSGYLQLFIPEHRESIAIEPMSCVGNAFNNGIGLKTMQPKSIWNWTINMDLSITQ